MIAFLLIAVPMIFILFYALPMYIIDIEVAQGIHEATKRIDPG